MLLADDEIDFEGYRLFVNVPVDGGQGMKFREVLEVGEFEMSFLTRGGS